MLIDLSLKLTKDMVDMAGGHEKKAFIGHLGTHFDVMNKEFPLEFTKRSGIVFDVSGIADRDIEVSDIDLSKINEEMFVAFYTGFIEQQGYGTERYFKEHPQLSESLIEELLKKKISIIGIDCAGVRRSREHTAMDQYCADRGVFIIENLCNLKKLLISDDHIGTFTAHTYPMNYADLTGLPCRVIAEMDENADAC